MRTILATLAAAALAGCGAVPFEYQSQREIPAGPGMFSGEDGAFVVRAGSDAAAQQPPPDWRESEEYREFQEWRERKRRNAESSAVK